jgi:uncharacterized protein YndB with AHSA1/START domain
MSTEVETRPDPGKSRTSVERTSDRDVVVTRTVNGPARLVFDAFTKSELLSRWWVPKSLGMTLLSCEVDARVGGRYRLVFDMGDAGPAEFFGTYIEVEPHSRLAWTNEESGEDASVTTITFEEKDGATLVVVHERYPSKAALDAAGTGAAEALHEAFDQLDELLGVLSAAPGGVTRQADPSALTETGPRVTSVGEPLRGRGGVSSACAPEIRESCRQPFGRCRWAQAARTSLPASILGLVRSPQALPTTAGRPDPRRCQHSRRSSSAVSTHALRFSCIRRDTCWNSTLIAPGGHRT